MISLVWYTLLSWNSWIVAAAHTRWDDRTTHETMDAWFIHFKPVSLLHLPTVYFWRIILSQFVNRDHKLNELHQCWRSDKSCFCLRRQDSFHSVSRLMKKMTFHLSSKEFKMTCSSIGMVRLSSRHRRGFNNDDPTFCLQNNSVSTFGRVTILYSWEETVYSPQKWLIK